jgi:hypothetical protein
MPTGVQRLVQVWASEAVDRDGACGSGWVLGRQAVLTAAHVTKDARVVQVRPAGVADPDRWVNANERWRHPTLDVAILEVVPSPGQRWDPPADTPPRLAAVGGRTVVAEAMGFPDARERPDGERWPDGAKGTLMPGGGVRDADRLMAFDVVDVTVPDDARLWDGFSGAGVRDERDRLVAVVSKATPDRERRRLFVVFLEDAAVDDGFAAVGRELGFDWVVQDRDAPVWAASVAPRSVGRDGRPIAVDDVRDLRVLGVHAGVGEGAGGDHFGPYVERAAHQKIAAAVSEAVDGARRFVLVSGDSAAGKSRSAAEVATHHNGLRQRPLVVPQAGGLKRLLDEGLDLRRAVIWLDDLDKHFPSLERDVIDRVLAVATGAVVIATVRHSQLQDRQEGLADPWWELLTNEAVVHRVEIDAELTDDELEDVRRMYAEASLLSALERGVGLGEYLVGAPELHKRFKLLKGPTAHFVNTVVAWDRTGIGMAIPERDLRTLWAETLPGSQATRFRELPASKQDQRFQEAEAAACKPVIERDWVEIALVHKRDDGYGADCYAPDDYIVDLVGKAPFPTRIIPSLVWRLALDSAGQDNDAPTERLWRVGMAAYNNWALEFALDAMTTLMALGDLVAGVNAGMILGQLGRSEAIAVYDDVVSRFGEDDTPAVREQVASALVNKGITLGKLRRFAEERAVYDDLVSRFGEDDTPAVREQVAKAQVMIMGRRVRRRRYRS